jgi:putative cardiolipin synthase
VAPLAAAHPGKTGIHLLPSGTDAFAARMVLAAAAQRSIDAQYYIWHGDQTGVLLFEALTQAARRGVRVRILLDDQTSRDNETIVAALGSEANVEVRYYNPFAQRRARFLDYLGDFARVNRRMHNKAFVVDNQAAVVGGRNIGNEYFGAGTEVPFVDLDVLAVGAAVPEVSAQFDLYWNSASAYPARLLVGESTPEARTALEARFAATRADAHSRAYLETARDTPLLAALLRRELSLEWAQARVVTDDPAKTLDRTERTDVLLLSKVTAGVARSTFDLVSPYFVPGDKGSAYLEGLARSGVRVRVLTNSFAATDVSVVHAGYAKRRERLAAAGVRLFELKGTGEPAERDERGQSRSGSSPSSLHAKTFAADGRTHLRRLVQLRPALRAPQYGDGPGHRESRDCRAVVGSLRDVGPGARLRSAHAARWRPRMDRTPALRGNPACNGTRSARGSQRVARFSFPAADRLAALAPRSSRRSRGSGP